MKKTTQKTETPPKSTSPAFLKRLRSWKVVIFSSLFLLIVLLGGLTAYAFYESTRILPHTMIAGLSVGGLTKAEALSRLVAKEHTFTDTVLTVTYQDKNWQFPTKNLNLTFKNEEAIDAAYAVGKGGTPQSQIRSFLASFVRTKHFDVDINPLDAAANKALSTAVLSSIETAPSETSLKLVPGKVEIVPGKAGQRLGSDDFSTKLYHDFKTGDTNLALTLVPFAPEVSTDAAGPARAQAEAILADDWTILAENKKLVLSAKDMASMLVIGVARDTGGVATGLAISVNDAALKQKLADFATKVNVKPTNALLGSGDNGLAVTIPDKPGLTLKVDTSLERLRAAVLASQPTHTVTADVSVAQADLRADTISSLGVTHLIGTGTTDFSGSSSNRIANITKGKTMINGQLVQPGQEFSTLDALGPIDQAHGYVQGLVIINNQTIPADGGGLCQVSTTLFRSVLNAGLPVLERQNHSYEVSYYQRGIGPGLDATIYEPKPDFRWKNDTEHAIYIQGKIKGHSLTFELYGTPDGRTASIDGPHTLQTFQPSGNPIYVNTNTLAKGVTQMIDPPVQGAKTTATYTVTRGGVEINKQTFNSFYQAMPAQYLVGTRE